MSTDASMCLLVSEQEVISRHSRDFQNFMVLAKELRKFLKHIEVTSCSVSETASDVLPDSASATVKERTSSLSQLMTTS